MKSYQEGDNMKILHTPARFHPFVGGVENYVYNLSEKLVERGHDVSVICADEPRGLKNYESHKYPVRRLNYIGKVANTNITPMLPFELLKEDCDIIHTHLPTPWSADCSSFAATLKRKPLVVTYHNDITGSGLDGKIAWLYNQTFLRLLLKIAGKIIITHPEYLQSSAYLSSYSSKVEVVPVGVDTKKFCPLNIDKSKANIFFLSVLDKFHRYKGLADLLKALQIVKKDVPGIKLIVGGRGKLLEEYRKMAYRLDLENNVEFVGFIPEEKIVEYYNRAEIFALPSTTSTQEGFGMVLLEAMACGKPVVTTRIVGISREVHECGAGEIVEAGDVRGLAQAINNLIMDKKTAKTMGIRGRRLVEKRYSWDVVAENMLEIYYKLINKYK
ncbi:MAG: glycosyltransferase family 4 protein [Methanothrix sp.]